MTDQTDNSPPAYPLPTGNVHADSRAKAEHFGRLTAYYEKNPPQVGTDVRVPVATAAQAAKPAQDPQARIAEFDQAMQASGKQRTDAPPAGEVDQRAIDKLQQLRRDTPYAEQSDSFKAQWERDYVLVLQGRRLDETAAQFERRSSPGAESPQPAPLRVADEVPAELRPAVEVLIKRVDAEGYAPVDAFDASLLHGYTLLPGFDYEVESTIQQLGAARDAGLTQAQVNAYLRALNGSK